MLASLLHHAVDLVFVFGREGGLSWHSPSVEQALGSGVRELGPDPLWSIVHGDDLEEV